MITRSFGVVLGLIAAFPGCDKVRSVVCEPVAATAPQPGAAAGGGAAPKPVAAAAGSGAPSAEPSQEPKSEESAEPGKRKPELLTSTARFALPFAWEKSPSEPLSRAKVYLRELADDNTQYMTKGSEFFKAFAQEQKPRATVITCADSRVQAGAFDATPENDDFTVRNMGNQLESTLGSVQYGVEELNTPVLLILGHTGCGAVKAALSDTRELPDAMRRELSSLHLKKQKGALDDKRWADAVLENVHDQVRAALKQFGARVNAAELTIIGAVYDFRNDLGKGAGRLTVIDVNGVQDEARLKAFSDSIMSTPNPNAPPKKESSLDRLARALAESAITANVHADEAPFDDEEEDDEEAAPAAPAATKAPAPVAKPGTTMPASAASPHGGKARH